MTHRSVLRPLPLVISARYMRSRRSSFAFITGISIIGLVISVAVLLLVQGIIEGFEQEMRERILNVLPHFNIRSADVFMDEQMILESASEVDGIRGGAGVIEGSALIYTESKIAGISLIGLDPDEYKTVSNLERYVEQGHMDSLTDRSYGVFLGAQLAKKLNVVSGQKVTLVVTGEQISPVIPFPRQKRFTVLGILRTGSILDLNFAYIHKNDAKRLLQLKFPANVMHFSVEDPLAPHNAVFDLLQRIDDSSRLRATTWMAWLGDLYNSIRTQKGIFLIILSLLVVVAAFNLVSTLVIIVSERRADVAILRTLGSRGWMITLIFMFLGLSIAMAGILLGVGMAFFLGWILQELVPLIDQILGIELMAKYVIHSLPVEIRLGDIMNVIIIASVLTLLATIYPAYRAASIFPASILRHE